MALAGNLNKHITVIWSVKMFVVKRCVNDFGDVWKWPVCEFSVEADAEDFAAQENRSNKNQSDPVWFEVDEE